jgi:hypothetical protein
VVHEVGLRGRRAVLLVVLLVHPGVLWVGRLELLEGHEAVHLALLEDLRVGLWEERPVADRFLVVLMEALWEVHLAVDLLRRFVLAVRLVLQVDLVGVLQADLWAALPVVL